MTNITNQNRQPIPIEMRVPEHVLDMVELTCELPIERNDMSFVIYNDADRDAWLDGLVTVGSQPITAGQPYVTATNTGKWENNDVSDEQQMPDEIWAGKILDKHGTVIGMWWGENEPELQSHEVAAKYIRAARGDEPGEASERIAQLEADLKAADEEARKLREIICDAWRKDALSDEDAQWLELKRLLQQTDLLVSAAVSNAEYDLRVDIKFGYESDHKPRFGTVADAITELQRRLAPPQRPTAESMIAGMRKCKTSDDLWDWWQDTLEDWHAAGGEDDN